MGKSDTSSLTSFECRSVLDSIQNEYEQKQREDSILSKLQEDLTELIAQRNILAKRSGFNEKYCVLCCSSFNLLFKRKVFCQVCHFCICRSCSLWDNSVKQWICNVCEKQRVLDAESRSWICTRIKDYFGNFGSAKVLQNFCRLKKLADSENDSGYGTTTDFMPLMKLLSSNSLNKDLKMAEASSHDDECEDDEDDVGDEEELAEIHHSIETILEGLLGSSLDDASVDHLFPSSSLYLNLFVKFHMKLVAAIQNLSRALQKALHNLPAEDGLTPTTAHASLKCVITLLVDECQDFPPLKHPDLQESVQNLDSSCQYADIFSSYDSLVAAAVINKVVEESQSKFKNSLNPVNEAFELQKVSEANEMNSRLESPNDQDVSVGYAETTTSGFDLPVECVQIEEVEEITQEFTDSEDDKLSSISKWSNSHQSMDEIGLPKYPDVDHIAGSDITNYRPIPFPEFGCDLVDYQENKEMNITHHPTSISSWEENWLFRKKKRLPLYSNLKYQLLTFCEEPPCMLIPQPSEASDAVEQDELSSELSETHSAGSLEFSSDSDEIKPRGAALQNCAVSPLVAVVSKSLNPAFIESSPVIIPSAKVAAAERSEKCHVKDSTCENITIKQREGITQKESITKNESIKQNENVKHKENSLPSGQQKSSESSLQLRNERNSEVNSKSTAQNSLPSTAMPPRPGTIAEREHMKWQNAVPLKNNPYSAENISKRSSFAKKAILKENISSFEEFERKLSVSSASSEPALNKVNCGPKSIDSELYKRDYYINQGYHQYENNYPLNKSTKHMYSFNDDCFDAVSEEALNSFEEKVYVSSGKVFTLENHVKRLEREIRDVSPTSDINKDTSFVPMKLSQEMKESNMSNKFEVEKVKKSRPCMKVHSLTARSLSREFRDLAKVNLPKPMNRTIQVPANSEDGTSERESLCSPESAQSSFSVHPADNGHGYTSDESNTSTSSIPRSKARRHISRSILERATYWERRAEQGLLSDASVSEEFPGIDISPQ